MNLLLVTYEPQPSGQTAHLLSLVRGLAPRGCRLTVVLPASLAAGIAALRGQPGVEVLPLPMGKIAWPPRSALTLVRLIRRRRFDLVHVHSQEAGLVARPLTRLAGIRALVYTPQTIDIRQARWQRLYQAVERTLARMTSAIIAVNEADRRRLAAAYAEAMRDPEVRRSLASQGLEPVGSSPQEFARVIRADHERWGPIIRKAGLKAG